MNIRFLSLSIIGMLTGSAVFFAVQSGSGGDRQSVAHSISDMPVSSRQQQNNKSNGQVPVINERPEQLPALAETILSSAEASTIEPDVSVKLNDTMLRAVFDAVFEPVIDDNTGNFTGFLITGIPDEEFVDVPYEKKIQNGDIVRQINGIRVNSRESLDVAITQLFVAQETAVITLDVERSSGQHSISFEYQP